MDPFADEIVFDAPAPKVDFPDDDLNAPLVSIETIFYLTISTPHTDTWEWQGPFASFDKIISLLRMHFPMASAKLDQLSKTKKTSGNGFTTLVVPDDNDTSRFRVFKVITEPNPAVRSLLPAPVFTVTRAGPLTHDIDAFTGKVLSSATKGRVRILTTQTPTYLYPSHSPPVTPTKYTPVHNKPYHSLLPRPALRARSRRSRNARYASR